jgi:YHS domain-containing protein
MGETKSMDPVCGREVAVDKAVRAEFEGDEFHFCSPECREVFLREMEHFQEEARSQPEIGNPR